jgi:hypothetical protein
MTLEHPGDENLSPGCPQFRGSFPPYLVLLHVGFTLPPALRPERCALTAPFHPYLENGSSRGGMFSVALAVCAP